MGEIGIHDNTMKKIKPFRVERSPEGYLIRPADPEYYDFGYSRKGSVKLPGRTFRHRYFKKEILNSYEFLTIGRYKLLLFTEGFEIDNDRCIKTALKLMIYATEINIAKSKEHVDYLKSQLSKYC
ncbi:MULTISPECIES: hypothetical protein [Tenacibaculum]|uniref:Uncharacterized protein n=1 Tax=Tenacibaculum finnmarkense genomovar ulcerans TaxID=2781388 RepID=A0A2I2MCS0_9FLAO|nr:MULTISPECIES: hypothetical protein [Tenacibaculum]MBE7686571.1 hypothetical protein [Tenacibaculum piscium]MBE7691268.1 hypothetical protein [Tenacibaculum piscium]MBE7697859.1 hypothetical protein [Tenacibaculum finnmarkense genomovar ulcerans]MCG8762098.1 hypothetical protein [Tenacibaculum finnmarkense]MCG8787474.1 hypothetical protein [Tenacibaculum finnmarkense]